ncbi:CLUMA_CG000484, isoform A [Clunio marinus]|uniref:CLUMA_CG000484, isoform A n=1 Tax=Clunio marinus TaxID=568069 RepID=A0A1J1HF87_9DIPT|nr:CLUMA_CG000484, isoform A [Clunio marinus]
MKNSKSLFKREQTCELNSQDLVMVRVITTNNHPQNIKSTPYGIVKFLEGKSSIAKSQLRNPKLKSLGYIEIML